MNSLQHAKRIAVVLAFAVLGASIGKLVDTFTNGNDAVAMSTIVGFLFAMFGAFIAYIVNDPDNADDRPGPRYHGVRF